VYEDRPLYAPDGASPTRNFLILSQSSPLLLPPTLIWRKKTGPRLLAGSCRDVLSLSAPSACVRSGLALFRLERSPPFVVLKKGNLPTDPMWFCPTFTGGVHTFLPLYCTLLSSSHSLSGLSEGGSSLELSPSSSHTSLLL